MKVSKIVYGVTLWSLIGFSSFSSVSLLADAGTAPVVSKAQPVSEQAPDYALWNQKLGKEAEALLRPYQITNIVLTHPTEGEATLWFQAGEFQKAFPILKQYAGQGSHRAQLEVGFMYQYGKGVPQDLQLAALWYYIAADPVPDNAKAMQRALDAYFGLDGESVDYRAASQWFQMAAELSDDRY